MADAEAVSIMLSDAIALKHTLFKVAAFAATFSRFNQG